MTAFDILFLVAAQVVFTLAIGELLLLRYLPKEIQATLDRNCYRLDGSWSDRRAAIERKALNVVRRKLWMAFALVLLPTSALLLFVDAEVVPLRIGFDALRLADANSGEWKSTIRDSGIEAEYSKWQRSHDESGSISDRRISRRSLWNLWPLMAGFALFWILMCSHFVRAIYSAALRELDDDARFRSESYAQIDLSRISQAGA